MGSVHPLDPPMSWLSLKKIRKLLIAITYTNMSFKIVFTLQMPHSFIKWRATARTPFKNPQWAHKMGVYCVRFKCYAGGKDEHVHPTLLTLR